MSMVCLPGIPLPSPLLPPGSFGMKSVEEEVETLGVRPCASLRSSPSPLALPSLRSRIGNGAMEEDTEGEDEACFREDSIG